MIKTSRAKHFGTAKMIKNGHDSQIHTTRINTYQGRGFRIKHITGDRQFECIEKAMEIQGILTNITRWDEHVPEVEEYIWTMKKDCAPKSTPYCLRNLPMA